eukprot:m.45304 g.45304  ORF g.45304 m.45304 type:complete len:197 (-) comp10991_c0_seq1:22-612(-)
MKLLLCAALFLAFLAAVDGRKSKAKGHYKVVEVDDSTIDDYLDLKTAVAVVFEETISVDLETFVNSLSEKNLEATFVRVDLSRPTCGLLRKLHTVLFNRHGENHKFAIAVLRDRNIVGTIFALDALAVTRLLQRRPSLQTRPLAPLDPKRYLGYALRMTLEVAKLNLLYVYGYKKNVAAALMLAGLIVGWLLSKLP